MLSTTRLPAKTNHSGLLFSRVSLLFTPSKKHQVLAIVWQLFHIENPVFAIAEALASLSCTELWVILLQQAISMATKGSAIPSPPFTPWLGPPPIGFCYSSPAQAPNCGGSGLAKSSSRLISPFLDVDFVFFIELRIIRKECFTTLKRGKKCNDWKGAGTSNL